MAVVDNVSPERKGRGERIEAAVQRELARRRRLMVLYLLLLLIPLGVGGWFIATGRSDQMADQAAVQQAVRHEVASQVAPVEQRSQEIATKLRQVQDLDKVLPEVQSAARQLDAQKIQVEELAQSQQGLQKQVTQVADGVAKLAPQIQQIRVLSVSAPDPAEAHHGLDARLDKLERSLNEVQQTQGGLAEQQKTIAVRLEQLQRVPLAVADVEKLDARLRALEKSHELIKGQVLRLRPMLEKTPEKPPQ
jgi:DNA repair exonuclease SbcCD ATPase subunit